jgi:hypothetical protein
MQKPPQVELTLYIGGDPLPSARAIRMLSYIRSSYGEGVSLEIRGLSELGGEAAARGLPTLIKASPGPRVQLTGVGENPRPILRLLRAAGLDPRGGLDPSIWLPRLARPVEVLDCGL